MATRDILNQASPNNICDALRDIGFGELINTVIAGLTATETGVSATSSLGVLANQPSVKPFFINATTATTTGMKKVLVGPISGPSALVPAAGQCVWDGGKNILFASVDAVTAFKACYAKASDVTVSTLQNDVGNRSS